MFVSEPTNVRKNLKSLVLRIISTIVNFFSHNKLIFAKSFFVLVMLAFSAVQFNILFFFVIEAFLILFLGCFIKKWYLLLLWGCVLLLHIIQILNVIQTGKYIEPLTLLNMHSAADIGFRNILFLFLLGGMCIFIYLFKLPKKSISLKKCFVFFVGFLIVELCCKDILPVNAAMRSVKKAYAQAFFVPKYEDGKEFLRKNVFEPKNNLWKNPSMRNNNVVLIFTEGLSSVVLSEKLTPNTYKLLKSGFNVENYYNHTAATYRGIKGQLMSGFLYLGGKKNAVTKMYEKHKAHKAETLESILRDRGYSTVFVSPHARMHYFNEFIENIGFQKVVNEEEDLSDKKLYANLTREFDKLAEKKKPFFLVTYVLGSHFGLDSPDLKYGDGTNSYLNKFYNQDFWFGKFLKEFEKSPASENTILVFTADHASYPSADFISTFASKSNLFADEMPLVIYKKGMKPQIFDAKGVNSLALAPTILNILGVSKAQNHFLGSSLFDKVERKPYEYMYVEGTNCHSLVNGSYVENRFNKDCLIAKKYYDYAG